MLGRGPCSVVAQHFGNKIYICLNRVKQSRRVVKICLRLAFCLAALTAHGLVRNLSIRGAPYDFRLSMASQESYFGRYYDFRFLLFFKVAFRS